MGYCRKLGFEEDPDYGYLRQLFRTVFTKLGFEYDYQFDWISLPQLEKNSKKEANNNTSIPTAPTTAKFVLNQKLLSEQNFMPSPVAVAVVDGGDIHQR